MAKAKKSTGLKKYQTKGTVKDSIPPANSKITFSDYQNAAKKYKSADQPSGGFKPKPRPYEGVPLGRPGKQPDWKVPLGPASGTKPQWEALKKGGTVKKSYASPRKKK